MTQTNEMPGVIWPYCFSKEEGIVFSSFKRSHDSKASYHHTAALIERLEGMKERYTNVAYLAALQDVIDILKGERE